MTFQDADVLLTICNVCGMDDVQSACDRLDDVGYPSWVQMTDYINEMSKNSEFAMYWDNPLEIYSVDALKDLTGQFLSTEIASLEEILNEVSL
mgnify:CR=1 FL=1